MVNDSITHVGCSDTLGGFNDMGDNTNAIPTNIRVRPLPPNPPPYKPPFQVGTLSDWIAQTPNGMVDAAIAAVSNSMATSAILDIAPFDTVVQGPLLGSVVIKSGRTTGRTFGYISMVNVADPPLINQIQVTPLLPADRWSDPGDSGSLILQIQQQVPPLQPVVGPVGLHWNGDFVAAGNGAMVKVGYANSMADVINAFALGGQNGLMQQRNLRFVVPTACNNTFPFMNGLSDQLQQYPAPPLPIPDAKLVEAVSEIKNRHNDGLMRIPGAIGNGVGFSQNGNGQVVIKILVLKITDAVKRAAPSTLEGVPVELQLATAFQEE